MTITNDQYFALGKLEKWYKKYNHQIIEISGVVGTGVWNVVQQFISNIGFDPREVMYLSYDQRQVLDLAYKRYHAYYVNGIIYKYTRIVDFDSLPIINPASTEIKYEWKKEVRKRISDDYKLIVVFDSVLMTEQVIMDLSSFGVPIILMRDPALTPVPDTYTFLRDPNIELHDLHPDLIKNPITYFANKVLHGSQLKLGNYDTVSVVSKKQLNLYNLKSADMTITIDSELSDVMNDIYRRKIMKISDNVNVVGERVIVMNDMYAHKLINEDEKNIKVYLTKGLVGYIHKCNKHASVTRYVPIEFRTEFYHDIFTDLYMDRHYLNGVDAPSRQQVPDEVINLKYAYSLPVVLTRLSHWDKVTFVANTDNDMDPLYKNRLMYNAITRAKRSITIVI